MLCSQPCCAGEYRQAFCRPHPLQVSGEKLRLPRDRVFDLPWGSALDDPETVCQLVEADVQAGFATWLRGGLEKRPGICLEHCAIGRESRRCVQSPTDWRQPCVPCQRNSMPRVREDGVAVLLEDVMQFLSRHQEEDWVAFLLGPIGCADCTYKRFKVAPVERRIFDIRGGGLVDASGKRK